MNKKFTNSWKFTFPEEVKKKMNFPPKRFTMKSAVPNTHFISCASHRRLKECWCQFHAWQNEYEGIYDIWLNFYTFWELHRAITRLQVDVFQKFILL